MLRIYLLYLLNVFVLLTVDASSYAPQQIARRSQFDRHREPAVVQHVNPRRRQQSYASHPNSSFHSLRQRSKNPQGAKKRWKYSKSVNATAGNTTNGELWSIESESYASDSAKQANLYNSRNDIFNCCEEVFGACRTSCESVSLIQWESKNDISIRLELNKFCSSRQTEFWTCINGTISAVKRGSQWVGRKCCKLGLSARCRNVCATSFSSDEIIYACRKSDEQQMFSCFDKEESADKCCRNARSSACLQACRELFDSQIPNAYNKLRRLHDVCQENKSNLMLCIHNISRISMTMNPRKYLHCCSLSKEESCQTHCHTVLNATDSVDVIGDLESGCGYPMPHLPLWQCFFAAESPAPTSVHQLNAASQINRMGFDAAKLVCCEKATSSKCKRLCEHTFSIDWTTNTNNFESVCLTRGNEFQLQQCTEEVDEPCEIGCNGLSFCAHFNNHPTELFRRCSKEADLAAMANFNMWIRTGVVHLPGIYLPIKNVTQCMPENWQAISCILQIKPCTRSRHFSHICKEDCYNVLNECIDWSRINTSINADSVCGALYPISDEIPCISLKSYAAVSVPDPKVSNVNHNITTPCANLPCSSNEVCTRSQSERSTHVCVPGCVLGETSNYVVPHGTYVRITVVGTELKSFKACKCMENGRIDSCQALPNYTHDNCFLPGGRSVKHGTSFYLECNLCSCFAAEITCTKKQCSMPGYADVSYTTLPCNCATHYVPVCGLNGVTYQSACIAKCLGLKPTEIEYGPCSSIMQCEKKRNKCPSGAYCLRQRTICLSTMERPCLQHVCVNQTGGCKKGGQPVCDSNGNTHASACDMLRSKATFGYWGNCLRGCSAKGVVCGINGVTYQSECDAWSDYVLVDYRGRCHEVGLLNNHSSLRCRNVVCKTFHLSHCNYHVPPGACCPLCGGAFHVIYSRKQIDRAFYAIQSKEKQLLTLRNVLHELDSLVQIAECQLTGFISMEVGLFIAIVPRAKIPTQIHAEACTREAEKISMLIELQSHRITTNLILSSLTVSTVLLPNIGNSAIYPNKSTFLLIVLIAVQIVFKSKIKEYILV